MTAKEMFENTIESVNADGPGIHIISPDATATMVGLLAIAAAIEGLTDKLDEMSKDKS